MNPKKPRKNCLHCGQECNRPKAIYCSNQCQQNYGHDKFIESWKNGNEIGVTGFNVRKPLRRYLFEKYDSKCGRCGWNEINPVTGNTPLEVEHIDGNWLNNKEENLTLLCPNCHSLTPTYKALNKGNGRKGRNALLV